ncbi:hypothetical protein ANO11243_005860 [Dothideomycetidae sp. 11243]|nr:hypothetical protein ANO11243_005860 [fungal sp. No.11243]
MRAIAASIDLLDTDDQLVAQADYILSIVPPKDALATAQRVATALQTDSRAHRSNPLYYLDLNAISPKLSRDIERLFDPLGERVRFIDGGIIGGPPSCRDPQNPKSSWKVPSLPMSGQYKLSEAPKVGHELAHLLNARHIGDNVGDASGLKMCFASLTKGFTALAIQSFTTAHQLGVLPELKAELAARAPEELQMAQFLTTMPPKAYRWVREMEEISDTFALEGGFGQDERIFSAVAAVYQMISKDTDLGQEIAEKRKRGQTVDDVAGCVAEGLERRKARKTS